MAETKAIPPTPAMIQRFGGGRFGGIIGKDYGDGSNP